MKFSALLEKAADELVEFAPPVGTWSGILRRGKFSEPRADKNGNDYIRANIAIELTSPGEDVDPTGAAKIASMLKKNRVFFQSDLFYEDDQDKPAQLKRRLKECGVSMTGRTLEEVLKEGIDGAEVLVDVREETYKNRSGTEVTKIVAKAFYPKS